MSLRHLLLRAGKCRSGATAVEFALVCLPLLLLLTGTVEFGRAFFVRNALVHAADAAAREVLIGKVPMEATEAEAEAVLEAAALDALGFGNAETIQVDIATESFEGTDVRVLTVSYPFSLLVVGLSDSVISLEASRRLPAAGA